MISRNFTHQNLGCEGIIMNREYEITVWKKFLGEICRNIAPKKENIVRSISFLVDKKVCSKKRLDSLVSVRYMAAYEQAINEYLHPPSDFKQANIKAELIHFGSLFEGISEILLSYLYRNERFTLNDYNEWFPKQTARGLEVKDERLSKNQKNGRVAALSFKAVIDCLTLWNKNKNSNDAQFLDFLRVIDMLRKERNMVHVSQMVFLSISHEEHKLVEVREKWLGFMKIIEKQI